MRVLLFDTNVVSILFKPEHPLHQRCFEIAFGHQWFVSFMTRGELLLWPEINRWGSRRREELLKHINLSTTLYPDDHTCLIWSSIMAESRMLGRTITTADAWVAATAQQWDIRLVTADYHDFEHLQAITLIPVG